MELLRSDAQDFANEMRCALRYWLTVTWMRAVDHPVPLEDANKCEFCKGTGEAHFCLTPGCKGTELENCAHPTVEEKRQYALLADQWREFNVSLMRQVGLDKKALLDRIKEKVKDPRIHAVLSSFLKDAP